MFLQRNTSGQVFTIPGTLRVIADGSAVTSGATLTWIKDGTSGAAAGTLTHISDGGYTYGPTQGETDAKICGWILSKTGAAGLAGSIRTTASDPNDAVRLGLTALPNTACTSNASLLTSGTGTDQVSVAAGKVLLQATQTGVTIPTVTTCTTTTNLTNAPTSGDFTATMKTSIGTAVAASAVASVTGAVGSVIGAVGSISGVTFPINFSALAITSSGIAQADLQTIKTQTVTCAGGVTVGAFVGNANTALHVDNFGRVDVGSIKGVGSSATAGQIQVDWTISGAPTLNPWDSPHLWDGTAVTGTSTTISVIAGLGSSNNAVIGCKVRIYGGTGIRQERVITAYNNTTGVATVNRAWDTTPDNTSQYAILYDDTPKTDTSLAVTAGTVTDKTGYSLTQAFPTNFSALGITVGGHISNVDTLTTYTGNTLQTGDAYVRIGAAGAGLTALGDARLAHLDVDVSSRSTYSGGDTSGTTTLLARLTSTRAGNLDNLDAAVTTRLATAGYTTPPTAATIATAIFTDTTASDFTTLGSPGKILVTQLGSAFTTTSSSVFTVAALANAPSGGGGGSDPLANNVPGSYAAGTAGFLLGTNLDARVSAVKTKTDNLPATPAATGDAMTLSANQHVIVDSGTITTLTNLPAIPANWLTAAGITAGALAGKGDWLLAANAPTNFSALAITAAGKISEVVLCDTLTTYTGNVPQTGDTYARLGAAGAGLTALGDARLAHLDADITSRSSATVAPGWYTTPPTVSQIDTQLSGTHGSGAWITATSVTVSNKTGFQLAANGLDPVMVEAGLNMRQAQSIIVAALAGLLSTNSNIVTIAAAGVPATNRITTTVDELGDRLAITINPPA